MASETFIRFEYGQEDRQSKTYGPYYFIQQTYEAMRVALNEADDASTEIAWILEDGLWHVEDGKTYSDFIVWAE